MNIGFPSRIINKNNDENKLMGSKAFYNLINNYQVPSL